MSRNDSPALPRLDRHSFAIALGLALTIALAHIFATWGHVESFWGDSGRWLHEVERYANGERVYRDFMWIFPPLAMWLVGGIARVAGPELNVILGVMSVVYLLIVVTWVALAARIVSPRMLPLTVVAGLLLSTAVAMTRSAPLPVGMYTPAAPVGGLMLLLALVAGVRVLESGSHAAGALLGVSCAACLLAKQDFWAPAGVLGVGVSIQVVAGSAFAARRERLLTMMFGGGILTLLVGVSLLLRQNDPGTLPLIVTGFGAADIGFARALPGIEHVVLESGVVASMVSLGSLIAFASGERRSRNLIRTMTVAGLIAAATLILWLWQAMRIGLEVSAPGGVAPPWTPLQEFMRVEQPTTIGLLKRAARALIDRLYSLPLPVLLPCTLLVIALVNRRDWRRQDQSRFVLLALLLSVCVAARLRRGFEQTEWYHVLLEVPTAIGLAGVAWGHWRNGGLRTQRVLLALVVIVAALIYRDRGTGTWTRVGRGEMTKSARGRIWLTPDRAFNLRSLRSIVDSIDPTGMRPLISAGYTDGFNYHLGRRSASPLTMGFAYSNRWKADSMVGVIVSRRPPVVLLDLPRSGQAVPGQKLELLKWERSVEWNRYSRIDRPYFDRLLGECRGMPPQNARMVRLNSFQVFDCSAATK